MIRQSNWAQFTVLWVQIWNKEKNNYQDKITLKDTKEETWLGPAHDEQHSEGW